MADDKAIDWGKLEVGGQPASQSNRETIVVHCANGHRLVVPAALAGKRAKCSKCHVTFQIQAVGDSGLAPAASHAQPRGEVSAQQAAARAAEIQTQPDDEVDALPAGAPAAAGEPPPAGEGSHERVQVPVREPPTGSTVSISSLVMRLWQEVEHGGIVELHLSGGSVVLPKWFEPRWSGGTHGLFASQAADGSVTLTAVAWDSIQKIVVRSVEGLPDGMFE
jgi:hypothetical protein